ncbi:anaerobic ribonucleoside-triphosphate reductase activating protein [Christensenellaceae bacterium]|nr:anaerobic ribonucleoside-triphosphate reductase activating protein [Christensenellaceae bacterium]BDF60058.1 anaerobic ribonucleoside-triphosphate reductase activating protein [Christensenellaceae bacterium]
MNIAGLLKNGTIDFPHRLAAVVFTAGCNYDCGFCHNRHLLNTRDFMDDREVRTFLEKRAGLLDGVVLSGGEPTLQKDLVPFAGYLKELGYEVKLDTNGSNPTVVKTLLERNLLDYVAMDYKAPFARYAEICGGQADSAPVRETLNILFASDIEWELRTTVIPQLSPEDLSVMADEADTLPAYALQLYRPVGVEKLRVYSPREIEDFARSLSDRQPNIFARC